jgi:recombinational DNA repair protein RecT
VAQIKGGNWRFWPMSVAEVEAHAKRYVPDLERAPAWQGGKRPDVDGLTSFDKMSLKTCLRMLLNARDFSLEADVVQALESEEAWRRETAAEAQGLTRSGERPQLPEAASPPPPDGAPGQAMSELIDELYGDQAATPDLRPGQAPGRAGTPAERERAYGR